MRSDCLALFFFAVFLRHQRVAHHSPAAVIRSSLEALAAVTKCLYSSNVNVQSSCTYLRKTLLASSKKYNYDWSKTLIY